MNIEQQPLLFDNLLVYETTQLRTEWQEGIFLMEDLLLVEGIYKNGPVFFSVEATEGEEKFGDFTYYLPINEAVRLEEEPGFRFLQRFNVEDALVLRQAQVDEDFYVSHQKIKDYANEQGIRLKDTYYCMLLEVYGEYIIDLYVPIDKEVDGL